MDKYLNKRNVISLLKYLCSKSDDIGELAVLTMVKSNIEQIPAADVRLVRRGHWEYSEKEYGECAWYFCSECDSPAEQLYNDTPLLSDFCPNCGADMRDDVKEDKR